jgi:hypothetical protein
MNHAQEGVTGEQRGFDLFAAVAPVVRLGDDWKKGLNALSLQLSGDQFFVAGARANRIPARLVEQPSAVNCRPASFHQLRVSVHSSALSVTFAQLPKMRIRVPVYFRNDDSYRSPTSIIKGGM